MRIIDNKNTVVVTCKNCQSTLELEKNDLEYHYHFGHNSYLYYNCEACDSTNEIDRNSLPSSWQDHIKTMINEIVGDDD